MGHCPALFAFFLKIHVSFLLGSKHLGAAHISDMAPIPVLKSQHLQPLNFLQSLMLPGTSIQPVRQSPLLQSRQNSQSQLNYKKRQSSAWSLLRTSVKQCGRRTLFCCWVGMWLGCASTWAVKQGFSVPLLVPLQRHGAPNRTLIIHVIWSVLQRTLNTMVLTWPVGKKWSRDFKQIAQGRTAAQWHIWNAKSLKSCNNPLFTR